MTFILIVILFVGLLVIIDLLLGLVVGVPSAAWSLPSRLVIALTILVVARFGVGVSVCILATVLLVVEMLVKLLVALEHLTEVLDDSFVDIFLVGRLFLSLPLLGFEDKMVKVAPLVQLDYLFAELLFLSLRDRMLGDLDLSSRDQLAYMLGQGLVDFSGGFKVWVISEAVDVYEGAFGECYYPLGLDVGSDKSHAAGGVLDCFGFLVLLRGERSLLGSLSTLGFFLELFSFC